MRRPTLIPYLLKSIVAASLLLAACSSDDTTTISDGSPAGPSTTSSSGSDTTATAPTTTGIATTPSSDSAYPPRDCVGSDWVSVDAGDFSFLLPPGVIDQEVQGIDSLVGQFVGEGLDVFYDYGWFSADLGDLAGFGAAIVPVTVDGLDGQTTTADVSGSDYPTDFVTALFVPAVVVSENASTDLSLRIGYDDGSLTPTAECITASVRFS